MARFRARGAEVEAVGPRGRRAARGRPDPGPARAPRLGVYAHYDGQPVTPADWATPPSTPVLRRAPDGTPVPCPRGRRRRSTTSGGCTPAPPPTTRRRWSRCSPRSTRCAAAGVAADRQPEVLLRGRGGGRARRTCGELLAAHARPAARRRLAALRRAGAPDAGARRSCFGVRGVTDVELTRLRPAAPAAQRPLRQLGAQPGAASWRSCWRRCATPTAASRSPASTTTSGRSTDAERAALAALPPSGAALLRRARRWPRPRCAAARLVERLMLPALNVRGLARGRRRRGGRATPIPATARASIDFRLVAGPDAARRCASGCEAHLRAQGYLVSTASRPTRPSGARTPRLAARWTPGSATRPRAPRSTCRSSRPSCASSPPARPARPVIALPTLGGCVPMHLFGEVLGAPTVILPIANHDNNQHAADENLRLQPLGRRRPLRPAPHHTLASLVARIRWTAIQRGAVTPSEAALPSRPTSIPVRHPARRARQMLTQRRSAVRWCSVADVGRTRRRARTGRHRRVA